MEAALKLSPAHIQIIDSFQTVFPNTLIPSSLSSSLSESLNQLIIKSIPLPPTHHTLSAINSMKNFVDKQELKIQINMIQNGEIEELPANVFNKKCSAETQDANLWDQNQECWNWHNESAGYEQSLHGDFTHFLD